MNYYKNLDILNSERKQLYSDIQNESNDKELIQYLKNVSINIDSLLESLFNDEGDNEENKLLVQELLEFHISSLKNLKNRKTHKNITRNKHKQGYVKTVCKSCFKEFYIHKKRLLLEVRAFEKRNLSWYCHGCRIVDVREECRYLRTHS